MDFDFSGQGGLAQAISNMFRLANQLHGWNMPESAFLMPPTFVNQTHMTGQQSPEQVAFDNIAKQTSSPSVQQNPTTLPAQEAPAAQAPIDPGIGQGVNPQGSKATPTPNVVIPLISSPKKSDNQQGYNETLF